MFGIVVTRQKQVHTGGREKVLNYYKTNREKQEPRRKKPERNHKRYDSPVLSGDRKEKRENTKINNFLPTSEEQDVHLLSTNVQTRITQIWDKTRQESISNIRGNK